MTHDILIGLILGLYLGLCSVAGSKILLSLVSGSGS